MEQFLNVALSLPSVVYTVLFGTALLYWVFVMVGAARVELLGDGAADGALDGLDGGTEGAAKGVLDGAGADGADGHGGDGHGDGHDGDGHHHGTLAGILAALRLRSAPATVVLSVLVVLSWVFCVTALQTAHHHLTGGALTAAKVAAFFLAPLLALPFPSLAVRPLARVFVAPRAVGHQDSIGKLCRIRTGTVTERFGEAFVEDGGAGLVVRVRVEHGEKLKRDDEALIVCYDPVTQVFTVAPMANLLGARVEVRQAAAGAAAPAAAEPAVDPADPLEADDAPGRRATGG
jgi:hypothetical protein